MNEEDLNEAIGRNVKRLRLERNQTIDDVVKAMQKAGYRWNATTQSNIERGARPLRAGEVLPLLRCMGYDSDAEEHIMQVYATPIRNRLDDLAMEMSLTMIKFEDEWCRFIRFRKHMLSILNTESSKDELTISDHDKFEKECEELSNRMLGPHDQCTRELFREHLCRRHQGQPQQPGEKLLQARGPRWRRCNRLQDD